MHEFKRFIQKQLDDQGLRQADLVTRSGLTRSHISKLMRDQRDHLGQMPDKETLEALAKGFGIPVERVRTAAARSLVGYVDDGLPISLELGEVPTDALLNELKRRIEASNKGASYDEITQSRTQEGSQEHGGAGRSARRTGAPIVAAPAATEPVVYRPKKHDKSDALIDEDQGSQADHELAARKGETEDEIRERLGIPYE
ncbi:helix-turn-helix domain-containing protein [Rhodococcoides fascians]|uniref:helix-turn-helix domain-containing protein n=1 Tax=Rhodococcoides fascians TaxID=1828 RepID=UPI00050C1D3D|nr:helix-turn-helix transcriptional regulator [Rhodococcus fascians]